MAIVITIIAFALYMCNTLGHIKIINEFPEALATEFINHFPAFLL
jgi:hypothetical protein